MIYHIPPFPTVFKIKNHCIRGIQISSSFHKYKQTKKQTNNQTNKQSNKQTNEGLYGC